MPTAKYNGIYKSLREKIEAQEYEYQSMLPSEYQLINLYACSRNTARRAIKQLADEGYVQSIHGKGVQIIYQPRKQTEFFLNSLESLKEVAARKGLQYRTKVTCFTELEADEKISRKTLFPVGTELYYVQRIRYLDEEALIIDHNYFRKNVVRDLTPEIAEKSVYEYMENVLGETIVTTKRTYTVERMTQIDEKYMDLNGYNCLAVVSSNTYNDEGIMFEYTQSRHRADRFMFYEQAQRVKQNTAGNIGKMEGYHAVQHL